MPKSGADHRQEIAQKYIELLSQGVRPWQQPWTGSSPSLPRRSCGTPYRGINVLILALTAMMGEFTSSYWMTFKQAQELGGSVRKGEKSTKIFFATPFVPKAERDAVYRGEVSEENVRTSYYLKAYSVFNAFQIDGLPPSFNAVAELLSDEDRIAIADRYFSAIPVDLRHGGTSAYLDVRGDFVQMPPFETFNSAEGYYSTLAHEYGHWSLQPSRLGRDFDQRFTPNEAYAFEELCVEIASSIIALELGLAPSIPEGNAAYVKSWLKSLRSDTQFIFKAATVAQKIVDKLNSYQLKNDLQAA